MDEYFAYLAGSPPGRVTQFPLSPLYISTYHNAQGLTLNCNIELDLQYTTCESIYVGLSRIQTGAQLKRIHVSDQQLVDLEQTATFNDEYIYSNRCTGRVFTETTDKLEFEKNSTKNLKIKKSLYVVRESDIDTTLMKVCKYIGSHREHVVKLMGTLPILDKSHNIFRDKLPDKIKTKIRIHQ